jgi:transposase-like protein
MKCIRCGNHTVLQVGASYMDGRKHYRCEKCKQEWDEYP